jgi:hypothetical protein
MKNLAFFLGLALLAGGGWYLFQQQKGLARVELTQGIPSTLRFTAQHSSHKLGIAYDVETDLTAFDVTGSASCTADGREVGAWNIDHQGLRPSGGAKSGNLFVARLDQVSKGEVVLCQLSVSIPGASPRKLFARAR